MLTHLADRTIVRVAGKGATKFLHSLTTQDLLSPASPLIRGAAFGVFLSPQGRVLYDCLFYASKLTDEQVFLDIHKSLQAKVIAQLDRHKLDLPLEIEATDLVVGVSDSANVPGASDAEIVTQDPRWRLLPFRFVLDAKIGAQLPDGSEAYRMRRMQMGVPEGPDTFLLNESMPLSMNVDLMNGVSFTKGCYVGQELTTRTMRRGVVRRRVVTIEAPEDVQLTVGAEIMQDGSVIGKMLSCEKNFGLAMVQHHGEPLNESSKAAETLAKIRLVQVGQVTAKVLVPGYFAS